MKMLLAIAAVYAMVGAGPSLAADTKATTDTKAATTNSQQDKMTVCNQKAGDMKGDERKTFMKTCLSNKPMTQGEKMSMCNKKTAGMAKEERSKAQSECMKSAS